MHYEINVSLNGRHFFATHQRSAPIEDKARQLYDTFKEKFPEHEGYSITVSKMECYGTDVIF